MLIIVSVARLFIRSRRKKSLRVRPRRNEIMNRYERQQRQKKEDREVWLAVLTCWLLASFFVLIVLKMFEYGEILK